MKVRVTLVDEIEVESMEKAYADILDWMAACVEYKDVTAFKFEVLDCIEGDE